MFLQGRDTYPDLDRNSTNPFNQMTDEERLEELIDVLAEAWAEIEKARKEGR